MQLYRTGYGWRLTHTKYLRELLSRYSITTTSSSPMPSWQDPEPEQATAAEIKMAQGITGAVLWAVTRTRPDLMYSAARMSQFAAKSPRAVEAAGRHVLKDVAGTMDIGLEFHGEIGPPLGQQSQLTIPRGTGTLELYSDASHAPSKGDQCNAHSQYGEVPC